MNHSALHFTITDPESGNFKPAEVRNDAEKIDPSPNSEQMSLFVNVTLTCLKSVSQSQT